MTTPAYDLRSSAKTKGNRPYLPPKYKVLMHLGYALIAISIATSLGYVGWGMWLNWKTKEIRAEAQALDSRIRTQDHMLWLADWRGQSIPFQELLVPFFRQLPEEVRLSQIQFTHNSEDGSMDMSIAINSDRNTSAQYFREITSFLQSRGFAIQLLEQNPAVGATVFKAKFRIMRRQGRIETPPATAATPTETPGA